MAARWARVPAICHLRAMAWRNHFDRWISRWLRGYICISQAVDAHQRKLGGRVAPSWVVYNGLDLAEFDAPADRAALRAEWGLSDDQEVVACVGRLVAWKGQRVLIEALARLATERPKLRGLIVGEAGSGDLDYAQELMLLARSLGIQDRVTFMGFREDIASLLHGVDVLAHTSISPEPFGRVIIEGMAAGAVVIGANAGAVPEIIQDGVTGLLVAPGSVEALAQAIVRVFDHPQEAQAMRQAARQAVEAQFTTARYVRGVEQVYEVIWGD
jgi:glycosyltransferase involved in cell wall biosynthesis